MAYGSLINTPLQRGGSRRRGVGTASAVFGPTWNRWSGSGLAVCHPPRWSGVL